MLFFLFIVVRDIFSIELTADNAIKIYDGINQIYVALSNTASSSALIHPNGRLHQYNSRIDIMAADGMGRNRFVYVLISCNNNVCSCS